MKSKKQVRRPRNKSKKFRGKLMKGGMDEKTPLHYACENGNMQLVEALVDRGADVNARDEIQSTPLHEASFNGHTDVALYLVGLGADVNARTTSQSTPLHYASFVGHTEVAIALVNMGADVNAIDNNGIPQQKCDESWSLDNLKIRVIKYQ